MQDYRMKKDYGIKYDKERLWDKKRNVQD